MMNPLSVYILYIILIYITNYQKLLMQHPLCILGLKAKQKTGPNILVSHISSVSLAVETVQPLAFQNAIIADITLPPMGNYSLRGWVLTDLSLSSWITGR